MKKLALILVFVSLVFATKSFAQDYATSEKSEYCILKVYGQGWVGRYKGIFIIREDLKVEEKNFKDDSVIGILKETMENITLLKNEGYTLISSTIGVSGSGASVSEYIFKKQK